MAVTEQRRAVGKTLWGMNNVNKSESSVPIAETRGGSSRLGQGELGQQLSKLISLCQPLPLGHVIFLAHRLLSWQAWPPACHKMTYLAPHNCRCQSHMGSAPPRHVAVSPSPPLPFPYSRTEFSSNACCATANPSLYCLAQRWPKLWLTYLFSVRFCLHHPPRRLDHHYHPAHHNLHHNRIWSALRAFFSHPWNVTSCWKSFVWIH